MNWSVDINRDIFKREAIYTTKLAIHQRLALLLNLIKFHQDTSLILKQILEFHKALGN